MTIRLFEIMDIKKKKKREFPRNIMLGQREDTDTGDCVFDNEIYPVLKPCEREE